MKRKHIGSSFESFLRDEGTHDEVDSIAQKHVITWQIEQAMQTKGITKVELAARMKTSRTQVDRLLDPDNDECTGLSICARGGEAERCPGSPN